MSLLERIVASKASEMPQLRARLASGEPVEAAFRPDPGVASRLRRKDDEALRLLAEIKFKSPSAGPLSTALGPEARALAYARGGASLVSVLCDGPFFDGSWDYLQRARRALDDAGLSCLLLAKEFVIDPLQVQAARRFGADAVLVIVRIAPGNLLQELVHAAREQRVEPLVEVVSEEELGRALDAGATVIGVNARDLDTLQMDGAKASRILGAIPPSGVALHLSGIRSGADLQAVATGRADGALLGEALMRLDDPAPLLAELAQAARTRRTRPL